MSSDFDVLIILERGDLMNHYLRILKLKPLELPVDLVIIYPSDLKKPIIRKFIDVLKSKEVKDYVSGLSGYELHEDIGNVIRI